PYLYGVYNNVYREAFVFDCAMEHRPFYLPGDGSMNLQFFHVEDLCRFMERILECKPKQHIFNVGNEESITVRDWAEICYKTVGTTPKWVEIHEEIEQRNYFSFYNYEYALDVTAQKEIMSQTKSLTEGLKEAYQWYRDNQSDVNRKPYIEYIENVFSK
ncbi:MAG: GDP-mannose 4,6-dehydratase, partial [Acetatifactor sp.]|nr:GDP-mannose 4,6-dehydratase [Acetatifactor sp.]